MSNEKTSIVSSIKSFSEIGFNVKVTKISNIIIIS